MNHKIEFPTRLFGFNCNLIINKGRHLPGGTLSLWTNAFLSIPKRKKQFHNLSFCAIYYPPDCILSIGYFLLTRSSFFWQLEVILKIIQNNHGLSQYITYQILCLYIQLNIHLTLILLQVQFLTISAI